MYILKYLFIVMLMFTDNKDKSNCTTCCGITRKHPKKIRHSSRDHWTGCLKYKQCPNIITPYNNVLAPSYAHQSKKIVRSQKIRKAINTTGRWKRVNWKRFQEQRKKNQEISCFVESQKYQYFFTAWFNINNWNDTLVLIPVWLVNFKSNNIVTQVFQVNAIFKLRQINSSGIGGEYIQYKLVLDNGYDIVNNTSDIDQNKIGVIQNKIRIPNIQTLNTWAIFDSISITKQNGQEIISVEDKNTFLAAGTIFVESGLALPFITKEFNNT